MTTIDSFSKKFSEKRFAPDAKPGHDMVQSFIDKGVTKDHLVQEILLQILAGSDTTAGAVRMILLEMISSPAALRRLLEEIEQGVAQGKVSSPITYAEAQSLPYLRAIVHEGLRVFPPALGTSDKAVPKGGDTLVGFRLPEGTHVATNTFGALRRKDLWGEDSHVFLPERFLRVDPEQREVMESNVGLAFGYGRYLCLGKSLAMMEIHKFLVEVSDTPDTPVPLAERRD